MQKHLLIISKAGYPRIAEIIAGIWGYPECENYINKLLYEDTSEVKGFPFSVIQALSELKQLSRKKDIDKWGYLTR